MIRTAAIALLAAGLLAGCGSPAAPPSPRPGIPSQTGESPAASPSASPSPSPEAKPHVLEIEATGTATLSELIFTLDGKVSEEKSVTLPWRKTVEVAAGTGRHEWKLTMRHRGGTLSATATVDGKLVTRTGGGGSPGTDNTSNLSGSFSG